MPNAALACQAPGVGTRGKRQFGSLRKLPSGRWQARYSHPVTNALIAAPSTFATKAEAARWIAGVETDLARANWQDPSRASVTLSAYAADWLDTRRVRGLPLAPSTMSTYRKRLSQVIEPALGRKPLSKISPADVRSWHAEASKVGTTTAAQAYRLLHAILATATVDGLLSRNPCLVKGASHPVSAERPLVDRSQVEALALGMPEHLRAFVLLAFWGGLRLGELLALELRDVDLDSASGTGSVRIERQQQDVDRQTLVSAPKAGSVRTVHLPQPAVHAMALHIETRGPRPPCDRVFVRSDGSNLRAFDVHRYWRRSRDAVGLPQLHVHDLRHAGLTLAAQSGATLAEVMRRAGHSTSRAALIYQHGAEDRDREVAERMSR